MSDENRALENPSEKNSALADSDATRVAPEGVVWEGPGSSAGEAGEGRSVLEKAKVNIATFRGIPQKLHDTLKKTAEDLDIAPGELARFFLETGLERLATGEEVITPSFVPGGYTLYPEDGPRQPRRKGRRKTRALQKPHSYYGVPRGVVQSVLENAQALGVTQGELARFFFERGLALYRGGQLKLEPVPVQQIATLYPKD